MWPIAATSSATWARMRSAIGFPLISVADMCASLFAACGGPGRTTQRSIEQRREAMGIGDGLVTSVDLEPFAGAAESLVGVAVIPVSAAPVEIELGSYELTDDGALDETGRAVETVHVPLAHTEGGLTASMTRGALAAGTIRTYVLHDRITRASCFVCANAGEAVALARWIDARAACDARVARVVGRPVALDSARSCAASRRTSSGRCATCSGSGRPATRSGRT